MKILPGLCALILVGLQGIAAAQDEPMENSSANRVIKEGKDSLFVGTWQLDRAQTKLGDRTVKYEAEGDSIRFTNGMGNQYSFKIDGSEHATGAPGETVAWKRIDNRTYEVVTKEDGKIESTSRREISPDGDTVTVTTTGETDGRQYTNKMTFHRQGNADSKEMLLGDWKQVRDDIENFPTTLTYAPAENGLLVTYEGPNSPRDSYTLVLDGQDRPPAADYRGGMTVAGKQIDDRTIQEQWKQSGKMFSSSTIQIAPDGSRLTETQKPGNPSVAESVFVYQRKVE
jgi:hypothetical protein